ncbi:hypothetical protein TA3x_003847 [Tundrisphaera sp. TA3]|uniref:hypothetical protein n=1 Tax=Tundrisphaera sp. TA3 TaxID=3435775 RepID=UPI003EBD58C3
MISRKWAVGGLVLAFMGCNEAPAGDHGVRYPAEGHGNWGQYGHGPHLRNRGPMATDFGPPFFTHGGCWGVPYVPPQVPLYTAGGASGSNAGGFGSAGFGAYAGAPAFPDTIAPHLRSLDGGNGPAPRAR